MKDIWHEPGEKPTRAAVIFYLTNDGLGRQYFAYPLDRLVFDDSPWCYAIDLETMLRELRAKAAANAQTDEDVRMWKLGHNVACLKCGFDGTMLASVKNWWVTCGTGVCVETSKHKTQADAWREWIEMNQPKTLPCRKCGNLPSTCIAGKGFWLSCDTCHQAGPTFDTANEAIEEWNKRMNQPKAAAGSPEVKKPSVSDDFWAWHKGSMEARQKLRDWYGKRVPLAEQVGAALSEVPPVDSKPVDDDSKIIDVLQDINDVLEAKVKEPQSALDRQVGGNHYKGFAIQPIDFIERNKIPFTEGCVIKYVARHREKGKAADIRKAIHFLEMLLEREYPEAKS